MLCPVCGQQNEQGASSCVKCGAQLPLSAGAAATGVYAGFWKRFAAALIDCVILVAVSALAGWVAGTVYGQSAGSYDERIAEAIGNVVGIIVWWLYYASLESSARQATLGKLALGIKVVDLQGGRIAFGRATGRHFGKFISWLILMIGFLMAGFTAKKQALHDMMAGCLVVNRGAPGMPAWAIVLNVVGAGVIPPAIVAAIAIPAYSDFNMRARVAIAISTGTAATRKVDDFVLRNKALPRDLKEAGMTDPPSRGVRSVSLDPGDGSVRVVLDAASLEGKSILFTPRMEGGNRIVWTCSSPDIRDGYLPAACRK